MHFYNTRDVKPVCTGSLTEREALARDCWPAPEVVANVNTEELGNLGLSQAEERAIVAFMGTLRGVNELLNRHSARERIE